MSVISGDNYTYTVDDFYTNKDNVITRQGLTADSTDTTPTAASIISRANGIVGFEFYFSIFNSSASFDITLQPGIGFTMVPGPTDTIGADVVKRYWVVITSGTTCNIYNLDYNGTPLVAQSITTIVNQISPNMVLEDPGAGTNIITLKAPDPVPSSYTFTMPSTSGGLNQVLTTDGTGIMSWSNSVLSGPGSSTDNAIVRWDGTVGNALQNSGIIIDDLNNITGIASLSSAGFVRSNTSFILEDPGGGTNTITLQAPTLSGNYTLTLPVDDGTSNQTLITDGNGALSWSSTPGITLSNGNIFVGNGSNVATSVTMSGDASIISTGALTIANSAVTNAKLANSSVTVTAGDGLQNGGSVSLGSSITIDVDSTVIRTTGAQSMSGPKTFTDSILLEDPGAGTNTITLQAPTLSGNYALTLPVDDGTSGQFLQTDGSGILTWANGGGGGDVTGPGSSTDNAIVRWDGTTGQVVQNSVVTIDDTGAATGFTTITASSALNLQDPDTPSNVVTIGASTATTGSYTLTLPVDDGTTGQLLQTDGSGVLSWTSPNPVCSLYASSTQTINGTLTGVQFDTSEITDTSVYSTNLTTGVVQILTTGRYQINYYVGAEITNNSGGARCSVETTIQTGSSGTGPWTTKPGSIGGFYVREQTDDFGTGKGFIINITANTFLRITFQRTEGNTNIRTKANSSSLSILKV